MQCAQEFPVLLGIEISPDVHSPGFVNGCHQNNKTDKTQDHTVNKGNKCDHFVWLKSFGLNYMTVMVAPSNVGGSLLSLKQYCSSVTVTKE